MSVALIMARTTRLVAIGLRRAKSALPINVQQKYCDHGRSTALLRITWPVLRARSSCAQGGKVMNASILPFVRRSFLLAPPMAIQLMSLAGSSPTLAAMILRKKYDARVRRVAGAYGLALQIDDAADRFVGEQLETSWMHPGQHDCGKRRRRSLGSWWRQSPGKSPRPRSRPYQPRCPNLRRARSGRRRTPRRAGDRRGFESAQGKCSCSSSGAAPRWSPAAPLPLAICERG